MTNKNSFFFFVFLLVLSSAFIACQQNRDPCLDPKIQKLFMGAYTTTDTPLGVITINTVSLPSPIIAPIGSNSNNTLYYGVNNQAHTFALLLSTVSDSCQYFVQADTTFAPMYADTLSFYYQRQLDFLSNACGYTYFYNLQKIITTNHNIDSVILENPGITTNVNVEHIKVYFHNL